MVPVLADTYSLLVSGLSAVRQPRSAFSVSMMASLSGSMTEMFPVRDHRVDTACAD